MSFKSLLIHTCDILRFTEGSPDAYGQTVKTWNTVLTAKACRLSLSGGREVKNRLEVVISDYTLYLDPDAIVTEKDRVSNIRLASDDSLVDASNFEILLVKRRSDSTGAHHSELVLQKVI